MCAVFRLWINALNIPDVFISDLFQDLGDGYILLQVFTQKPICQPQLLGATFDPGSRRELQRLC